MEDPEGDALPKGAQTQLIIKEHVGGMVKSSDAVVKDAQIKLSVEECASVMGQKSSDAVMRDARVMSSTEAYARDMGLRRNYAAVKDALIFLRRAVYALRMGRR
jgi:hypothetical protein